MKELKTTNGYICLVDDEDFDYLNSFKWRLKFCSRNKKRPTSVLRVIHTWINKKDKSTSKTIHREILEKHNLDINNKVVDHIDGNVLNNQKSNLRICSNKENCRNRKPSYRNKTGFLGVHIASNGKFKASIRYNKAKIHLGTYETAEEAGEVYKQKSIELFGEFSPFHNQDFKQHI